MNNRPVSGRISETQSHPIDMNNSTHTHVYAYSEISVSHGGEYEVTPSGILRRVVSGRPP
jgi:hypothetical protein